MSDAAPDPAPQSTRSFGLLVLVRALIDYGRELAGTLRQHGTAALGLSVRHFGTDDISLILARIAHGLHLAAALELRITATATRLDADPDPPRATVRSAPRPPRALAPRDNQAAPLAAMPTPEQIAAEVRRRPIGAVIADICRDLGITPSHKLWQTSAKRHHPLPRQLHPPDHGHAGPGLSASRPHRPPALTPTIDHTSRS